MSNSKTILIILDGWGHGDKSKSDAIFHAKTPYIDSLYKNYPNSELLTDGEKVGLPNGQMGNSEVGHLNIGAGRIVDQDLVKINKACSDNSITTNKNLQKSIQHVKENNSSLHIMGLVSDGGIHSHIDHLYKLIGVAQEENVKSIYLHAFTDGRDCDPNSGLNFIKELTDRLNGPKLATVCGRYYAMDRDKRWERIKKSYDAMVYGIGEKTDDIISTIQKFYDDNITDEFIPPIICQDQYGKNIGTISDGDAVICFNYRTDRCREITTVLTQQNMPKHEMNKMDLHFTTMTNYDDSFLNVGVIFEKRNLEKTLGEVLENHQINQTRIAETEKYPHVTYFFSGGREKEFKGERRIMANSPKVATYDLKPEMSAYELTEKTVLEINENSPGFICLNFANPDMVGHTGKIDAISKAVEVVDKCTQIVVEEAIKNHYNILIIADHGNADFALNSDGSPNTAHTTNPVPCFLLNSKFEKVNDGILADVSPTILKLMGIEKPEEMTGKSLV